MSSFLVTENKVVSIVYTIRDSSGSIVEYTDLPVSYVHGVSSSPLFPQVETALEGLGKGEQVDVFLTASEAFGDHDPDLIYFDELENTPEELHFVGAEGDAENDQGEVLHFIVTDINDGKITVDANHPLAGQDVTFTVRAVSYTHLRAHET